MVVQGVIALALALPTGMLFGVGYGTGVRIGYEQIYPLLFPKKTGNEQPNPSQVRQNLAEINKIYDTIGGKEASNMGIAQGLNNARSEMENNPDFQFFEELESKLSGRTPSNSNPHNQSEETKQSPQVGSAISNQSLTLLQDYIIKVTNSHDMTQLQSTKKQLESGSGFLGLIEFDRHALLKAVDLRIRYLTGIRTKGTPSYITADMQKQIDALLNKTNQRHEELKAKYQSQASPQAPRPQGGRTSFLHSASNSNDSRILKYTVIYGKQRKTYGIRASLQQHLKNIAILKHRYDSKSYADLKPHIRIHKARIKFYEQAVKKYYNL